jgi:thymidylate synthase
MYRNNSEEHMEKLIEINEEIQYLKTMKHIVKHGTRKPNRTKIDTLSVFGNTMRFTLSNVVMQENGEYESKLILPLLTTKKMVYRLIVEELLWFISGSTDAKILEAKKIKIWTPNSSRDFLDKVGLKHLREGDIGAGYGFQLRHFGAQYRGCDENYIGEGVDQFETVRQSLLGDPYSRRHVISLWNPCDLKNTALAPCHLLCQFNVDPVDDSNPTGAKYLDCSVYQRSADVPLGVPFNIASYATLTHIIAQMVEMIPRHLIYTTGDTHIYDNQITNCHEQIEREPLGFPYLELKREQKIEDYSWENFKLQNYKHHPEIKYPFSV